MTEASLFLLNGCKYFPQHSSQMLYCVIIAHFHHIMEQRRLHKDSMSVILLVSGQLADKKMTGSVTGATGLAFQDFTPYSLQMKPKITQPHGFRHSSIICNTCVILEVIRLLDHLETLLTL